MKPNWVEERVKRKDKSQKLLSAHLCLHSLCFKSNELIGAERMKEREVLHAAASFKC